MITLFFNKIFTTKSTPTMKKCLLAFLLLPLSILSLSAQDLYDINKIQEIKIYFTQPNWNNLLLTAAVSTAEPYTVCKRVIINGEVFDSVGVKYKGNSSFNTTRKKNPWHIELDNVKDQNYQGYKDIKLSNIFQDPSCVREALSYNLMQPYTDLPRANYAKVWVNDTLIGLYTNVEAVTKTFCKKHFSSSGGNIFVKCTPPSLGGGGAAGGSSLAYLGADSSLYYKSYEMYSDYGWKQLIHLADTLNNKTASVEKILDIDHNLWMLAYNILFVNLDSYTGGFTQNYYLWRDDNGRFNPIIWDVNMSFGSFTNVGAAGTPGSGTDSLSLARLNPFTHEANAAKPLISKILPQPTYRKMYIAHLRTMLNEVLKSGKYRTDGEYIRTIIDAAVQGDPNNLSTYNLFKTNFYYGAVSGGTGGGGVTGIVSLMENKIKYLDTLAVMKLVPPTISNMTTTPNVKINDTLWITAKFSNYLDNGNQVGYRNTRSGAFERIYMFDDGKHKDGAAQDGVFGVGIKMTTPSVEYYIWAENAVAGIFSPERAEHEFHQVRATFTSASDVVINEVMATNTKTVTDPKGEFDDWIELYNKSNAAVNLSGWYISDDATKRKKWQILTGTSIPANGYLIIWADEDSSQNTATSLHANFKLSASGEDILLSQKDSSIADQMVFGAQKADISYARRPNGTGNFVTQTPTFGTNNNTGTTAIEEILPENALHIYPNPSNTEGGITVDIDYDNPIRLQIFNTLGQMVYDKKILKQEMIQTHNWQSGLYIVRVGNISKKLIIH
jgi:hypothetical protein